MNSGQILKKLRFSNQDPVLIVNAPEEYQSVLSDLDARIETSPRQKYTFVHLFVHSKIDINQYAPGVSRALDGDGMLWISYPKKSSKKYQGDISRDSCWGYSESLILNRLFRSP